MELLHGIIHGCMNIKEKIKEKQGEQRWRIGESTRPHQCDPGLDARTRCHKWLEFVGGSLLCSERPFSGYSSFPLPSKTNTSKFQFDPECSDV